MPVSRGPEQMDNWYNVLFSVAAGPLTDDERERLSKVEASWVLLNTRLGRFFIDIIGPKAQLQAIRDKLTALGRDPIVIGIFDSDGALIGQPNKAEWLKVAQDVNAYDADGVLISTSRPTAFVNTHQWAGWAEKRVP